MTVPQFTVSEVIGSTPPSDEITVETGKLGGAETAGVPNADDATVEVPGPAPRAKARRNRWGVIQGHRRGRGVLPRRSIRQLVEGLAALLLLTALTPVLVAVALAVKWTSKGPVLFRQDRLGLHRSTFSILKFRTMTYNNDDAVHRDFVKKMLTSKEEVDGGEQGVYKLVNDPRITPIGGFLRRTSLDELPQLWNVVRGEMSLVGPRPVLAWEAELFPPEAERRFAARPGLTGLWQVSGRSTLDFKAALELDVSYVERKSVWFDVVILLRTVAVVFNRSMAR